MTIRTPNAQPVPIPRLAFWLFQRGLVARDAATALGISSETVRRYCLPFGNPKRHVPGEAILAKIVAWTDGEVTAADFYPPHLNGADRQTEEAAP